MKKNIMMALAIAASSLASAAEEDAASLDLSSLKTQGASDLNRVLDGTIQRTHQFSSARMQRILEHEGKFTPRIVGGIEARVGAYPWAVALAYYDANGELKNYCGGSLIGSRWILTAAHCEVLATDVIVVGRHDLKTSTGSVHKVLRFIPNRKYNKDTSDDDIALIELESDVPNAEYIRVNADKNLLSTGSEVTVIGWGLLTEGGVLSNTLQEVPVPIVDHAKCNQVYANLTDNMLCAGEEAGGKDSCQGDSGGPLMAKNGASWVQVGIVSFGYGCARAGQYGVYTNTSQYEDWINGNIH